MNTKNNLEKLNGLIIGEVDYKEYDKMLTILTKEKGKIKVYAFNVRRQNSKNIGKTRIFSFGTFEVRAINDNYQLENVILKESFDKLSDDYTKMCYAYYFVELVDYLTFENIECENICLLLYYTFKALINSKISPKLIRRVFELKMLEYQGEYKESNSLSSNNSTLIYTWDFVLKTLPNKLYTFNLSDEIFSLFDNEVSVEMREKINRKFKTLDEIRD